MCSHQYTLPVNLLANPKTCSYVMRINSSSVGFYVWVWFCMGVCVCVFVTRSKGMWEELKATILVKERERYEDYRGGKKGVRMGVVGWKLSPPTFGFLSNEQKL